MISRIVDVIEARGRQRRLDKSAAESRRSQAADRRLDGSRKRRKARRERATDRRQERQEKAKVWAARRAKYGQLAVLVGPILLVNAFAIYGQIGFALEHLFGNPHIDVVKLVQGTDMAVAAKFVMALVPAILFGLTVESIATYIGWHAHEALMAGDSAAKLRLASYGIGAVMGGLNYEHFTSEWKSPTPLAVIFGLFSMVSPWLWAMHGRRANRNRLREMGLVDERAPHFSASRWLHFPWKTLGALRYGIKNNVQDPAVAWDEYMEGWLAEKDARVQQAKAVMPTTPRAGALTTPRQGRLRALLRRGNHTTPELTKPATKPTPRAATKPTTAGAVAADHTNHAVATTPHRAIEPGQTTPARATATTPVQATVTVPDQTMVTKPKKGGRPAKIVVDKAKEIYEQDHARGVIHNRRSLAAAVNAYFNAPAGQEVIGDTACGTLINKAREQMRQEKVS